MRKPLRGLTVAAIVGGLALVLVAFWFLPDSSSETDKKLDARMAQLRTAIAEPTPPAGSALLSRDEFKGDLISDGPAIYWTYSFGGTEADFVQHYRSTVPSPEPTSRFSAPACDL